VLQCVAVFCSVLQCVAVCSNLLQREGQEDTKQVVTSTDRMLQCVTVCCSVLQCAAMCCSERDLKTRSEW